MFPSFCSQGFYLQGCKVMCNLSKWVAFYDYLEYLLDLHLYPSFSDTHNFDKRSTNIFPYIKWGELKFSSWYVYCICNFYCNIHSWIYNSVIKMSSPCPLLHGCSYLKKLLFTSKQLNPIWSQFLLAQRMHALVYDFNL